MNESLPTVAALYVDSHGVYANLPGVEVWDEERDARTYLGPWPVVAHPPCERWSILGICRGYYDGADAGCFAAALGAVTTFGGVLEHPAHSLAWRTFGLPRPPSYGWSRSLFADGWCCAVDQWVYGHPSRKPTWLYYVGDLPPPLLWGGAPRGTRSVQRMAGGGNRQRERSSTPLRLRDELLAIARGCAVRKDGSLLVA